MAQEFTLVFGGVIAHWGLVDMGDLITPRELRHWASEPRDFRTVESALLDAATVLEQRYAEISKLRFPWRNVDRLDWEYIESSIPDSGQGKFWKAILADMRAALSDEMTS